MNASPAATLPAPKASKSVEVAASSERAADRALVEAYLAGDARAFREIVEKHRKRLLLVARRYSKTNSDADDILQEALLRASRKLHTFRAESSLSTWLHRLVMNSGWDHMNHRSQVESPTLDEGTVPLDFNSRLASDPFARHEVRWHLQESLNKLSAAHRDALVKCDVVGFGVEEVARQEGVAPGTIKSRRSRAREALRAEFYGYAQETTGQRSGQRSAESAGERAGEQGREL